MHVQTFFPEPPVERFDGGVVRGLAAPAEIQDDAVGVNSGIHRRADELGSVVAVDPLRQPSLESETLQRRRDILSAKALSDIDRQVFAGKQVYDSECPEAAVVGQRVRHEIHDPDLVASHCWPSLLAMDGRRVAPRALPPERQAFLDVHAIEALFADIPAFAPQQHQQPAIAEPDARLGQFARR